ncbi:FMN-binding protein [Alkaliphilus serpentinus]|uniref:FMN-binding protein n=1 Tax=Alkaliphilus serpentinus TaxID=1482731 RepID=A0A833HLJ7_9FIRM|nr:FMN-binding protein [Alkaliphilus serpentinus]KAB3525833.1 FMN-binding protein [Alkaliphilus serpentinus]
MKKFKLFYIVIAVFLTLALAITGCQQETEPDPQPDPPVEDPVEDPQDEDEEGKLKDGEYSVELDPDERGWRGILTMVVEGGEITEATFDELNEDDESKLQDEDYIKRWEEASNVDALAAIEDYQEELIETQNPEEINVVSGATSSHTKFVELAKKALEEAE